MIRKPQIIRLKKRREGSASQGDINRLFDLFLGSHQPSFIQTDVNWHPSADMFETDNRIVIVVEIAGIHIEELSIVLQNDQIILQGIRQEPRPQEKRQYHNMEIPYGPFERIFTLSSSVNPDRVDAQYNEGFLRITLEKRDIPIKKKRTIKIK